MKKLLYIAFYLNLLVFVYIVVPFVIVALFKVRQIDITYWCYFSVIGRIVLSVLLLGILFLWFDNIRFFLKYDKNTNRLLLLIFISWVYSPIYFLRRDKYRDIKK